MRIYQFKKNGPLVLKLPDNILIDAANLKNKVCLAFL